MQPNALCGRVAIFFDSQKVRRRTKNCRHNRERERGTYELIVENYTNGHLVAFTLNGSTFPFHKLLLWAAMMTQSSKQKQQQLCRGRTE